MRIYIGILFFSAIAVAQAAESNMFKIFSRAKAKPTFASEVKAFAFDSFSVYVMHDRSKPQENIPSSQVTEEYLKKKEIAGTQIFKNSEAVKQLGVYLHDLEDKGPMTKIIPTYRIGLISPTGSLSLRVTEDGQILGDLPASTMQTMYRPKHPGFEKFLADLTKKSR